MQLTPTFHAVSSFWNLPIMLLGVLTQILENLIFPDILSKKQTDSMFHLIILHFCIQIDIF